jgi:predicted DNA-binding transcriptional regulator AlpA
VSPGPTLRIRDVGAYLGVSHQRADQMFHEGKFPEPEQVDAIGPQWTSATIKRWAERDWWGTRAWRKRPES